MLPHDFSLIFIIAVLMPCLNTIELFIAGNVIGDVNEIQYMVKFA